MTTVVQPFDQCPYVTPNDSGPDQSSTWLNTFYLRSWGKKPPQALLTTTRNPLDYDESETKSVASACDSSDVLMDHAYTLLTNLTSVGAALGCRSITDDQVILVRSEFARIQAMIDLCIKNWRCLVLTGEQGIGKTILLIYLLLYRLERQLPTAIQLDPSRFFIFDHLGATVLGSEERSQRLEVCVALVDGSDSLATPCFAFYRQARFIVHTSLLGDERFSYWADHLRHLVMAINPPTTAEMITLLQQLDSNKHVTCSTTLPWILSMMRLAGSADDRADEYESPFLLSDGEYTH